MLSIQPKLRGDRIAEQATRAAIPDFDPEIDEHDLDDDDDDSFASSNEAFNDLDGREHYEAVGKSNLRKEPEAVLPKQYAGSATSRALLESEDENDPFEDYDSDESQEEATSRTSFDPEESEAEPVEAKADVDSFGALSDQEDDEMLEGNEIPLRNSRKSDTFDRAEMRKLLDNQQQDVSTSIVESQRADAVKGAAVQKQRKTFASLLTSRIRLQNGLVAMNTIPTVAPPEGSPEEAVQAAEDAARKLWSTLDELRCTMADAKVAGSKRKRCDQKASPTAMWEHMRTLEATAQKSRRSNLLKWSDKTQSAANVAAKNSKTRLDANASSSTLLDVLDAQLADPQRLVEKTKVPRSGAPAQAKLWTQRRREKKASQKDDTVEEDSEFADVFDDADFYAMLLKELIEQRQEDGGSGVGVSYSRDRKSRNNAELDIAGEYRDATSGSKASKKQVDTKASKGRKMRFEVHEKLLNFMVPENRGTWSDRQATELFSSLFGAKNETAVNDYAKKQKRDNEAVDEEEQALRLFRS